MVDNGFGSTLFFFKKKKKFSDIFFFFNNNFPFLNIFGIIIIMYICKELHIREIYCAERKFHVI
jgi:hypothetical protein